MPTNGRLDLSNLTLVDGWAHLTRNAAAAWEAGCDEIVALGHPRPTITAPDGAYRPYAQQVAMKAYWTAQGKPENAATAGTSGHGWATDVDIFKNWLWPHALLVEVFGKYGFTFNVSWEDWHMHHNGTATASLIGDKIMALDDKDKEYLKGAFDNLGQAIIEQIRGEGVYDYSAQPNTLKRIRDDIGFIHDGSDDSLKAIHAAVLATEPGATTTVNAAPDLAPILDAIKALPAATVTAIKNAL